MVSVPGDRANGCCFYAVFLMILVLKSMGFYTYLLTTGRKLSSRVTCAVTPLIYSGLYSTAIKNTRLSQGIVGGFR